MSVLELGYIIILWKEFHESLIMTLPSVMHSVMLALSERMLMEFQAKNKQIQNTKRQFSKLLQEINESMKPPN
jgi:hypothetical protein